MACNFFLLAVIAVALCACNSTSVNLKPDQKYELDNGITVYQLSVDRSDGTKGILLSNYDGSSREKRPLILHITGSGCDSNLRRDEGDVISGRSFGDFLKVAGDRYWLFTYEKRGVLPFESVGPSTGYMDACREEYYAYDGADKRSKDNIEILEWLRIRQFIDDAKIALAGCSEGGYVAARMARDSRVPTHVGSFSGVGPSQMYDFLIFTRGLWKTPEERPEDTEHRVEELMHTYRDIMNNPTALDKAFLGHPYKKWSEQLKLSSLDDLLQTDRPIFMAHAGGDDTSPIESADFAEIEFIRRGKNNLTFKRYPGLDHGFRSCSPFFFRMAGNVMQVDKNPSCDAKTSNKFPVVINDFMAWLDKY